MKPDFALTLSFEGIGLLVRAGDGWRIVGDVPIDVPDLGTRLAALREAGAAHAPADATGTPPCKLVIPNEQIRYLSIPAPAMGEEVPAVREALDGATPYEVSDLSFDWMAVGGALRIAAVARETLEEAEDFAREHGFAPVAFTAAPEDGDFPGEVFFGRTRMADQLLPEGETVAREDEAAEPIGPARAPRPAPATAAATTPLTAEAAAATPPLAAEATPEEAAPDSPLPDSAEPETPLEAASAKTVPEPPDTPEKTVAEPPDAPDESRSAPATDAPVTEETTPRVTAASLAEAPDAEAAPTEPDLAADTGLPDPEPVESAEAAPGPFTSVRATRDAGSGGAPRLGPAGAARAADAAASRKALEAPPPMPEFTSKPSADDPPAPAEEDDAPVGFFSRRKTAASRSEPPAPARGKSAGTEPPVRAATPAATTPASTPKERPAAAPAAPGMDRPAVSAGTADTGDATESPAAPAPAASGSRAETIARVLASTPGSEDAQERRGALEQRAGVASGRGKTSRDLEREQMTIFGARSTEAVGGKPRFLGLALTMALLLFLAGVAAWASLFVEDGLARFFGRESPVVAALPGDEATEEDPAATTPAAESTTEAESAEGPVLDPELAAEIDGAAEGEADTGPEVTIANATPDPEPEPAPALQQPTASEAITPEEARARYAATGVWERAPQPPRLLAGSAGSADIYVASIDRDVPVHDAVALPSVEDLQASDQRPSEMQPPPPEGVRYRVDERGFIEPTEDGIVAPGGYTLYSGEPPILPRPRPGSDAPALPDGAALPAENAPILASPEAARLIEIRPRERPGTLVEDNERSQLGGRSREEMAVLRPRPRPEALAQAARAREAERASAVAEAVAEAAAVEVEAESDAFVSPTDEAVQASLAPRTRPGDFASIVRQAERQPDPAPQQRQQSQQQQVAAAAPRAVQPSIPSAATVSRRATVENAINLRRVNLIGVYGKPSNRRALIRLPNGRYEKVAVGDRIDGGRVAAIGETQLRYVKGGRSVMLEMPSG